MHVLHVFLQRTDTEEFWRSRAAYRIFRELPPLFFSSDIDLLLFSGPCVRYNLVVGVKSYVRALFHFIHHVYIFCLHMAYQFLSHLHFR